MEEQSNEALWYVVHTYSGYENKVANDLQTMAAVSYTHLRPLHGFLFSLPKRQKVGLF